MAPFRWAAVVAPAERLARLGVPVSRALSRDLQVGAVALGADSEARRLFGRGTGTAVTEGDNFVQTDLAATLGILRQRGGTDLLRWAAWRAWCRTRSRRSAAACRSRRCAVPCRRRVRRPAKATAASASMSRRRRWPARWRWPDGTGRPRRAARCRPTRAASRASRRSIRRAAAAACSLSMGQLFGARVMVPNTGILLGTPTADSTSISPVVIGNPGNGEVLFAGAGGGSPSAAYATGLIARGTVADKQYVGGGAEGAWRPGRLRQRDRLSRRHPQRRRELQLGHRSRRLRAGAQRHAALTDVAAALASFRRRRSVHRHGRDGGRRREGGGGRHGDPSRGRPAQHAGAQGRAGRGARRARYRPHRLCRGARHSGAARAHRAPLSRQPWRRRLARARGRDDRLVGRLSARLPRELRCRRPRGAGRARISRLSQHPRGAQSRGRRPADLGRRPLPADRRGAREGGADRRPDRRQPVQSDRHDGDARRAQGAGRLVPRARRAADLRRDLSRHRVRG